ncbi:2-polyprenyl-6-methoxyphenol hydroxylase-like FAD-dependent oxidoreductase [Allocatelliglobosispora scoriae]|uniref:2-polyprenyl-6-methoxyphenol hydroxylase-like FAD-dependent oxidoreductase n=1 Tax=Allocatelliglobosispora scoriae TaxID=643052 RepID=A0A841BZT7_9ACTN|nr:FAD-dependent monooxygenase [Allocatelliglobosispora scoriae]MBB5873644.1 2-polyprenyl-6-methoxyphenol hydroxylase-like FAD-dependent oxidoreductase [Allocatelliglobosispora scoriae]
MDNVPVVVVGAGPVGMMAALELAHHGVECVLAEQNAGPTLHPKMEFTNPRTMEHHARLGLADDIRKAGVPAGYPFDVLWSTGLDQDGERLAVWHQPSVEQKWQEIRERNDGSQPSQPYQRISQADLEPVLLDHCRRHPLIDVRHHWRFDSLQQDADGVTSTFQDLTNGTPRTVRSQYIVGCDGAGSAVRQAVGIPLSGGGIADGEGGGIRDLPVVFSVTFRTTDTERLFRHGYFWHHFTNRYVLISLDEAGTWSFHALHQSDFDPPPADPAAWIRSLLNVDLDIEKILVTSRWKPQYLIADSFRSGRVLLAGDSAHQMFPAGSHGMNTGAGDAVDLGWKLAALVNGYGGPTLLDSYEIERRPVGLRNMAMSRQHLDVHFEHMRLRGEGGPLAPLGEFLSAQPGENTYEGIYLDYRYAGSPIVCADGTSEPESDQLRYVPSTWPGSRPPSVLLADGSQLFDHFGPEFTLLDLAGDGRADALLTAAADRGLPVRHVVIREDRVRELWECDLALLRPDQHVAWRGERVPADPVEIVDRVRGAANENTTPLAAEERSSQGHR